MPDQPEIRPIALVYGKKGLFNGKKLIWHELCLIRFNSKKRQNLMVRFMKNISLDKYLIQIFRETAEKSGWNIYRKGRKWIPSVKRRKLAKS